MRKYKKQIDALKNSNIFILISVDRFNLIYFGNQKTIHHKLSALKKRLAFTNRVRKLEMIRKYKNLQKAFKHQQMNQWLLNWEKIYAKTKRLNLSDVQNDQCAYDFLNALRTINLSFVFERKTILNHEMNQDKFSTSIRNLLKEFRNHFRIARTLITKKTTHEAFATLQEKSSNNETTYKKNQRNSRIARSRIDRACVIKNIHSMNATIWSRNFDRLNENRTKKWWKKSKKFLNQIQELERQWNEFAKTSKDDWKKSSKKRMTRRTNRRERNLSSTMKWR
jgi:hypothetical protein